VLIQLQSPYVPAAAEMLLNIPPGAVPYISAIDLIIFKINSCGLRAQGSKRFVDANDAQNLLTHEAKYSPISLTTEQLAIVDNGLTDVLNSNSMPEKWWRENLGLA
jgi:hypothetical protein